MARVALAFLWHHHQPLYKNPLTGSYAMPWVRLHATRDYPGMALLLGERTGIRATFNLVPSLLDQLEDCAAGLAVDPALAIARKPPGELEPAERLHLVEHAFSAPRASAIDPYPRYRELRRKRYAGRVGLAEAAARFTERDLRDLATWWNLSWFHPLLVAEDADVRALRAKGRDFDDGDLALVLERQRAAARRVIPLYASLEARGVVELSTTPYFHPILPLLLEPASVREAMPGAPLPKEAEPLESDAREQVRRALESHARRFGRRPRGMWPAEGSVSEAAARLFAEEGVDWIASDEGVLARSLGAAFERRALYRPYRAAGGAISIVFRDHALSDAIGFQYQRVPAEAAVADFMARLAAIRDGTPGDDTALVPVILDGENCWEHFPGQGVEFLRRLYDALEKESANGIETVRLSDELAARPATATIDRLAAGSWIGSNFKIWAGHAEDRAAWDALYRTRRLVERRLAAAKDGDLDDRSRRLAREEILIAEGSDWFWWFGDENSSGFDHEWDALFRSHLANACAAAGVDAPAALRRPIAGGRARAGSDPSARLAVTVDGRAAYFEWVDAGRFTEESSGGAAARAEATPVREIRYGFAEEDGALLVRVDARGDARSLLEPPRELALAFSAPIEARISLAAAEDGTIAASDPRVAAAAGRLVEVKVPLAVLGSPPPGAEILFRVEVREAGRVASSLPSIEDVALRVDDGGVPERSLWP